MSIQILVEWAVARGHAVLLPYTFARIGIDITNCLPSELISSDIILQLESVDGNLTTAWVPIEQDEQ